MLAKPIAQPLIIFRGSLRFALLAVFFLAFAPTIGSAQIMAQPKVPDGFQAELLYKVPDDQGSWVCITTDPKGRLITSDQYGKLYRTTITEDGSASIEPIDLEIGFAQGLLCAFDSLYVVSQPNKKDKLPAGVFRIRDTDGDDKYDSIQMLKELNGGGEHGPHAVILSPDKKSLYICAGNHTNLPPVEKSRVPRIWEEDQVLPRLPDANGHARGKMAPGGWICKMDPEGKELELISSGYRNQYDIAFDPNGELFTYDADMEWDVGLPWYRPTRVCHAVSGSEFGWRHGTGKWPAYYPDSLPAVVDIGPGSPTGIVFGTGAKFPAKYQHSLFISDWSYGIIYNVTLTADGASYKGEAEVFCAAPALPVTDLVVNPKDGAMYFLIGGRRSQSGLYRVSYVGKESTAPAAYPELNELAKLRREIESTHGQKKEDLTKDVWKHLSSKDRFIRYAARTAIEHQEVGDFLLKQPAAEKDPQVALEAALALVRTGKELPDSSANVMAMLEHASWDRLDETQKLHYLRVCGLILTRLGTPTEAITKKLQSLNDHYPTGSTLIDRELARILAMVKGPSFVDKTLKLLESAGSQHEQIHYALALSANNEGWTTESRTRYFDWFLNSAKLKGGNSFGGYLANIRKQAVESLSDAEREELKDVLLREPKEVDPYADLKARPFVKKWTMEDLLPFKPEEFENRNLENGKELFAVASCYKCHRIKGQGGIVGPDLTPAGHRFSSEDLLETMIDPSKAISDQYSATIFQLVDGQTIVGRVVNLAGKEYRIQEDMIRPNSMKRIKVKDIEAMKPSSVSLMPTGLLDNMTRDDILDLMAYLKSTGKK